MKKPAQLPVIIGSLGGLNPASRIGYHQAYRFVIREHLPPELYRETLVNQAHLMGLIRWDGEAATWREIKTGTPMTPTEVAERLGPGLEEHCFIRKPDAQIHFDPYAVPVNRKVILENGNILWPKKNQRTVVNEPITIFLPEHEALDVSCGGLIPDGVALHSSQFGTKAEKLPRNLKLALFGACDALKSLGIPFAEIAARIPQDQIGVYVATAMSQVDPEGLGYLQAPFLDERAHSTAIPFSLSNMAADFIAAYVLGSLGHISCDVGACATFLFNLHNALRDIRTGKIRFALIGCSDAPLEARAAAAYSAMKALGRDEALRSRGFVRQVRNAAGEIVEELIRSKVSIPFGDNFGFTLSEGSSFMTLFHPDLAVELGVKPLGAFGEVFCHSDGWKSSISKPGIGNYLSFGKALGSVERDLGPEALKRRSFISAHGSSTPQNRVTESAMFERFAQAFGITQWPITAVKSWLGHTLGSASGDQIAFALGAFHHKIIARIRNLEHIPEDVSRASLHFCQKDFFIDADAPDKMFDACIVNAKGFGGHNATGIVYSPELAHTWLTAEMNPQVSATYESRVAATVKRQEQWHREYLQGAEMITYVATQPYTDEHIENLDKNGLNIKGLNPRIKF